MNLHVWYNELSQFFSILSLKKVAIKNNTQELTVLMHDIRCVYIIYISCQKRAVQHKFDLLVKQMYMFLKVKSPCFRLKIVW
jgi:hypothetical protein